MTIVADKYDCVFGIKTYSHNHTYAIINRTTGAIVGCESFPVAIQGANRAIA